MHPAPKLAFALFGTIGVTSPAITCSIATYGAWENIPKMEVVALVVRNMAVLKIYHQDLSFLRKMQNTEKSRSLC